MIEVQLTDASGRAVAKEAPPMPEGSVWGQDLRRALKAHLTTKGDESGAGAFWLVTDDVLAHEIVDYARAPVGIDPDLVPVLEELAAILRPQLTPPWSYEPGAAPVPAAAPTLTMLEPNTVAIGQPSFDLHVHGLDFVDGSVIVFNGNDEPTTVVSETEVTTGINMDVWTGPSLPLPVTVRNPDGQSSNALTFTFTDAAVMAAEAPAKKTKK